MLQKKIRMNMLRTLVYSCYGTQILMQSIKGQTGSHLKNIVYYPAVRDNKTLGDLFNRVSWYFPDSENSKANVIILVKDDLLKVDPRSLVPPDYEYNYIGKSTKIRMNSAKDFNLSDADAIMVWDKRSLFSPIILSYMNKVNIVDPTYYFSVEADAHRRMYNKTVTDKNHEKFLELSRKNYRDLIEKMKIYDRAYLFGTGPSLEKHGMDFDYDDGFRVVCNSIVKNKDLMNHIKPHLLVLGDAVHHMSPSHYTAIFWRDVLKAVNKFQCNILTEDYHLPLILAHFPGLKSKLIGLDVPGVWDMSIKEILEMILRRPTKIPWFDKIPGHDEKFNFPTPDKMYVRLTGSVLPSHMIPVASAICKNIFIIGADGRDPGGRQPDEKYIWSYSSTCQYDERTSMRTNPSYYRDRPLTEDFDIYCENFDDLVRYGELKGKKYFSLTPSYIPALARRFCSSYGTDNQNGGDERT